MGTDSGRLYATRENVAALLSPYGIAEFSFREIEQGFENKSIFIESGGQKYVLRIYRQRKTDAELELAFQNYLRERRIPIPRVFANLSGSELIVVEVEGRKWQAILMEFADGLNNVDYTPKIIQQLSLFQARMHLLGIEFAERIGRIDKTWTELSVRPVARAPDIADVPQAIRGFVERGRGLRVGFNPRLPHGYNHLDLDVWGNVIVRDGAVSAIIDFDGSAYSPCVVCLANSVLPVFASRGEEGLRD